jgi:hypothetical protein
MLAVILTTAVSTPGVLAGPPAVVLKPRPEAGGGLLIVGAPVTVEVSLRARLPSAPLRWTLVVQDAEVASGTLERLADGVPRREFEVSTTVDHQAFARARGGDRVTRGSGQTSPSLVRDVKFALLLHKDGRVVVAKGVAIAKVTCDPEDPEPVCDTKPSGSTERR